MQIPEYLSPTGVMLFRKSKEEYYRKYLATVPRPREPQTQAMAIGSAFDVLVKRWLHKELFDEEMDLTIEGQVEPQHLDWAVENGRFVFEAYKERGALLALLKDLEQSRDAPVFEGRVQKELNGIPLLGFPDLFYTLNTGEKVIIDWKVNGYCSKSNISPARGYTLCYGGRTDGKAHKDAMLTDIGGITVNVAFPFEDVKEDWATQTSIYSWLMGTGIGESLIVGIEQAVGRPEKLRFASHRGTVSRGFQLNLWKDMLDLWERITTGYFFKELSPEEDEKMQESLDSEYMAFDSESDDPTEAWFGKGMR